MSEPDQPTPPRDPPVPIVKGSTNSAVMLDSARKWLDANFEGTKTLQPDWYFSKLGMFQTFITDVFGPLSK